MAVWNGDNVDSQFWPDHGFVRWIFAGASVKVEGMSEVVYANGKIADETLNYGTLYSFQQLNYSVTPPAAPVPAKWLCIEVRSRANSFAVDDAERGGYRDDATERL